MVITNSITAPDSTVFAYHRIVRHKVNLDDKVITVYLNSWELEADALANIPTEYTMKVEVTYVTYDPSSLLDLETLITGETWEFYGKHHEPEPTYTLAELKALKSAEISAAASAMIYEGFASNALSIGGTETEYYYYPSLDKDQTNLIGAYSIATSSGLDPSWTYPIWCKEQFGSELWAFVDHDATEVKKVGEDGINTKTYIQTRNLALQEDIEDAVDEAAVAAIVWTDTW